MALPETEPGRLRRAAEIFGQAQEIAAPAARAEFVRQAAAGDAGLTAAVEALLDAFEEQQRISSRLREMRPAGDGIPRTIGRYHPVKLLGRGGTGSVYLATRDTPDGSPVAIKTLDPALNSSACLERFRRECQIMADLDHPGIARIFDSGLSFDGHPYLVMEYVEGVPMDRWAARMPLASRLGLFQQVCAAADYAHRHLVVHRDLKPANILVNREGAVKLLDFGLAKLLDRDGQAAVTRTMMMTPRYASPEQLRGEPAGTPADVYALGVILYELVSGRHPYPEVQSPLGALERALRGTPPSPPAAPKDLATVILKAMAHEPDRRYRGAWDLSADVDRFLRGHPVAAHPPSRFYEFGKFARRHAWSITAAALLCATLAGGIATATAERRRADHNFSTARRLVNQMVFRYHDAVAPLEGSGPLRQRIAADAASYLETLSREAGNDPALVRELALTFARLGEIEGGGPSAIAHYRASLAWFSKLDPRAPDYTEIREKVAAAMRAAGQNSNRSPN